MCVGRGVLGEEEEGSVDRQVLWGLITLALRLPPAAKTKSVQGRQQLFPPIVCG